MSLGGMGSNHQNERINFLRQLLDSSPSAPDGFLSYEYGLCPPRPLQRLPSSDTTTNALHVWEQWADHLPNLYQTGKYLDYFLSQPILTVEHLADEHLLRANQILGLCAHATVHFSPEIPERIGETPGAWVSETSHNQEHINGNASEVLIVPLNSTKDAMEKVCSEDVKCLAERRFIKIQQ